MTRLSPVDRGPFNRALGAAIARHNRLPLPECLTLCDGDGQTPCALPAGHADRTGLAHVPAPWRRVR